MKKITFLLILGTIVGSVKAQTNDTVYDASNNSVFYSLENGVIKKSIKGGWDIAFGAIGRSATILINGGNNTELYSYHKGDTAEWDNVDTTGMVKNEEGAWKKLHNSDTSWNEGAFNKGKSANNRLDVGWGIYSGGGGKNPHYTYGDSLYIIGIGASGQGGGPSIVKKLWIEELSVGGVYKFRYANIDGSDEESVSIALKDDKYKKQNFAFYSIKDNKEQLDYEPENDSWDLFFGKGSQFGASANPNSEDSVTAAVAVVFSNRNGIKTERVEGVPVEDAKYTLSEATSEKNIIGGYWTIYNKVTHKFATKDSLTYFIHNENDSSIWKVVFKSYSGGKYIFTKERINWKVVAGIQDNKEKSITSFKVYPNPTTDHVNIIFNAKEGKSVTIEVHNLGGGKVHSETILATSRVSNQHNISLKGIKKGIYIVTLNDKKSSVYRKLVVE